MKSLKNVTFKFFLFPFFLSSAALAQNSNHKIGSFCIFQNNPSQGEWAKDANGKIIELNANFVRNIKCDESENDPSNASSA